jgi:hypothetical protein
VKIRPNERDEATSLGLDNSGEGGSRFHTPCRNGVEGRGGGLAHEREYKAVRGSVKAGEAGKWRRLAVFVRGKMIVRQVI